MKKKIPITVIILTKNEATNIEACIQSCSWCDDVHVLDSGSTDGTQEIAKRLGIPVHFHAFESFGSQRNWAIDNIPSPYQWQFHLDADERFTPEIVDEMLAEIGEDGLGSEKSGYYVPSKLIFMKKWLRYSGNYPTYQMRFFHIDRCRFMDYGHGQREETAGEIGTLKHPYLHFNFSKGLFDWFEKHNNYSTKEAKQAVSEKQATFREVIKSRGIERRRALKSWSHRLPGRPALRFLALFIFNSGWRDGLAGFYYCLLISIYELMIVLKIKELRQSNSGAPS